MNKLYLIFAFSFCSLLQAGHPVVERMRNGRYVSKDYNCREEKSDYEFGFEDGEGKKRRFHVKFNFVTNGFSLFTDYPGSRKDAFSDYAYGELNVHLDPTDNLVFRRGKTTLKSFGFRKARKESREGLTELLRRIREIKEFVKGDRSRSLHLQCIEGKVLNAIHPLIGDN